MIITNNDYQIEVIKHTYGFTLFTEIEHVQYKMVLDPKGVWEETGLYDHGWIPRYKRLIPKHTPILQKRYNEVLLRLF